MIWKLGRRNEKPAGKLLKTAGKLLKMAGKLLKMAGKSFKPAGKCGISAGTPAKTPTTFVTCEKSQWIVQWLGEGNIVYKY